MPALYIGALVVAMRLQSSQTGMQSLGMTNNYLAPYLDTTIAANKYSNIWLLVGALVHSKVTETPRQRFITCITDSVGPWI